MTEDAGELPTDRRSPVGEPVIRGDEGIAGQHADEAKRFDPEDPESVAEGAETVRSFATDARTDDDTILMLRGAAACAALVRAEGSYKAAAERAGEGVTVQFVRKWARVHDLPRAIRIHVARGDIPPTAAKHIARLTGEARYRLAWGVVDNDLTVREVRTIASEVNDGSTVKAAFRARDIRAETIRVSLSPLVYRELRRRAALEDVPVDELVDGALAEQFDL